MSPIPGARCRHFGRPAEELTAALERCALADRSDLGRLIGSGPDLLPLLQRLGTGDVAALQPHAGTPTVLTTPKGRIVERLFVHRLGRPGVLLVGGAGSAERTLEHLKRYTFAEKTGLSDVSSTTCQFVVFGPGAAAALAATGLPQPERYQSTEGTLAGAAVHVLGHDGIDGSGFGVVAPVEASAPAWSLLAAAVGDGGGLATGKEVVEAARILRGAPAPGHELTEEHNPLEAEQWDAVSFAKGCYVGQEVVARLRTYDKISRCLVRLELSGPGGLPETGMQLFHDGRAIGTLTSAAGLPGTERIVGLGFLKRREVESGMQLHVGAPDAPRRALLLELVRGRSV